MAQKALGRAYNVAAAAKNKWVAVRPSGGVAFVGYLGGAAGDTYTLQEAKDASGTGAQNLAIIADYHTNTGDGSDAWVKRTQAAAATVTTAATAVQQAVVIEVLGVSLDDGYTYVKLNSSGAATIAALQTDLSPQRQAANLPAMGV